MVTTLCGMGLGVELGTHAALSTPLHGPTSSCHAQPTGTTDNIEMRVCISGGNENIVIEIVEIFIQ